MTQPAITGPAFTIADRDAAKEFLRESFDSAFPQDAYDADGGPELAEGYAQRRANALATLHAALERTWAPGIPIADWAEIAGVEIGLQPEI